ncbi:MAG TPA: hypothetical protein PLG90_03895 [Ignavibacteria bacterium]|nr:hypothetical protein [Ignavibacteria bacterium]
MKKILYNAVFLLSFAVILSSCSTCKRIGSGDSFQESENPSVNQIEMYRMSYTQSGNRDLIIDLLPGEATFLMEYTGNSNFRVRLLTNSGQFVQELANANGKYNGVAKYTVPEINPYLLEIRAEGPWSINYY